MILPILTLLAASLTAQIPSSQGAPAAVAAHRATPPVADSIAKKIDTAAVRSKLVYPFSELQSHIPGAAAAQLIVGPRGKVRIGEVEGTEDNFIDALIAALVSSGVADTNEVHGSGAGNHAKGEVIYLQVAFSVASSNGRSLPVLTMEFLDESPSIVSGFDDSYPEADQFVPFDEAPAYQPATLLENVVYPDDARRNNIEGMVIVSALIDKKGKVVKTMIERSDNPILNAAAKQGVEKTPFTPALLGKKPIAVWIRVPVIFKLQ